MQDSTEPCAGQVQVDSPSTGKLPCLNRCPTNITNSHEWEIQYPQECVCDGVCTGFCKRVLFLSNGSFQLHDYDNNCSDRVLSTGDTNANYSRCWPFVEQMYIDHMSGSLKGPNAMWDGLKGAFANCSVQGCLNDQLVEVKVDQLCEYVCRLVVYVVRGIHVVHVVPVIAVVHVVLGVHVVHVVHVIAVVHVVLGVHGVHVVHGVPVVHVIHMVHVVPVVHVFHVVPVVPVVCMVHALQQSVLKLTGIHIVPLLTQSSHLN